MSLIHQNDLDNVGERSSAVELRLVGLNYRTAPLILRERFGELEVPAYQLLRALKDQEKLQAGVVLSTCHRVELLTVAELDSEFLKDQSQSPQSQSRMRLDDITSAVFERLGGVQKDEYQDSLYYLEGQDVVRHLFRVASGMDSMIIGEPQILGQVKRAYKLANQFGTTCNYVHRLFHSAFGAAKDIRMRTDIGCHAVSLCYAIKEIAKKVYGQTNNLRVMLIGTGEMGTLALKHFQSAGASELFVVSHSCSRAEEQAALYGAQPISFEQIEEILPYVDVVVGATTLKRGSTPILTAEQVTRAYRAHGSGKLFLADLGVPRNFHPSIAHLPNTYLYNIDQLGGVVDENLEKRKAELAKAEILIDRKVEKFISWVGCSGVEPLVREFYQTSQVHSVTAIELTLQRLARAGFSDKHLEEIRPVLEDMTNSLIKKNLHMPVSFIRNIAGDLVEEL